MVITLSLNQAVTYTWGVWNPKKRQYNDTKISMRKLDPAHTYIVIGSLDRVQQDMLKCIEDNTNVLFKSNKAVNKTPGHGTAPRNTIIVFELKE